MIAFLQRLWRSRGNVLRVTKDGGPESTVWAHWLFEVKGFASIVLLVLPGRAYVHVATADEVIAAARAATK